MAEISEVALANAFAAALKQHDEADGKVRETRKPSLESPFNPTGGIKPKLRCETVFCGAPQQEDSLKAEEIELFNKLQAGRYNKGKWTVQVLDDGMGTTRVDVRVPVNDINALMDLPNSLVAILTQIVTEAGSRQAKTTK